MIIVGKMNESIGMTQDDWKKVDPNGYDEGQVEGYIRGYDEAAKALKCKAKDLVNITEDDDEAYNKIIRRIKESDKGQKVKMPSVDGFAGLYTLTNGCTIVSTNEWGYGTVYVKKSELKKAMNESISSEMNEASKTYTKKQMDTMIDDSGGAIEFTDGSAIGTYSGGGSNGGKYIIYKNAKDEKGKEVNASAALDYLNSKADKINESINDSTMSESTSGKWVQVDLNASDDYKYCGNGGRSWVTADSKSIDTWDSKEDAIADGKKNYKRNYKYGRDWDVVQLKESVSINESVNFKGLVNLANKNEDVSKHKDLGKACWQYLFPRIKDMARDLDIEDTNIIVKAIYDWIKKHENMNESVELNESAKIGKMTKAMGQGYSGVWQLPSGSPGLFAEAGDMELVVLGDEDGIQIILQDEDVDWFKSYPANKEKEAVAEFKKVAALMNDLVDASKLAKKFGLTTM